jgi:aspartyl protease family protein
MAGLVGLVVALARAFPEALRTSQDWTELAYRAGFVVLIGTAAVLRVGPGRLGQHLRHAAIWVGLVAAVALVVAYRDEFSGVPQRLRLAFSNGDPVVTGERELVVPQDEEGAFEVVGRVNGQRVSFIVDTGATDTVLAPADARRLGLDVDRLDYAYESETANGKGYGAGYVAERLEVGPIAFDSFPMTVNQAPMSRSLLGMSFLRRLDSFEVRGRNLILRWRQPAT